MVLYRTHQSVRIFPENYSDCTLLQQYFLSHMTASMISFEKGLDTKVKILCEAMGVKFKNG